MRIGCRFDNLIAPRTGRRRGVVLFAVLVVIAILMLVGYQFHNLMVAEHEAVHASNRVAVGRYVADSGLHYAAFILSYPQTVGISDGSDSVLVSPIAVYDNPSVFLRRPVNAVDPRYQGYFTIVAPRDPDDPYFGSQPLRFGVEDESGKINLNSLIVLDSTGSLAREALQKLPNMTEDAANAILNWLRAEQTDASANADVTFYSSLGYTIKGGPYESAEELLLIRGLTPRMFFGNDLNRNGLLDPEEDDGSGFVDRGLSRFFTIYSREPNVDATGQPRIYVNDSDLQTLWQNLNNILGESLANFIVGYRLYSGGGSNSGGQGGGGGGGPGGGRGGGRGGGGGEPQYGTLTKDDLDLSNSQNAAQISSLYDLIDAEFSITRDERTTRYRSPLQSRDLSSLRDLLPDVLDKLTTTTATEFPGGVNINTAPREVLLALPDLSEQDVQMILDNRPNQDMDPALAYLYRTPAWLLTEAGFDLDTVRNLAPFITTRSFVYRVQVIGYYEMGGPVVRLEAVIDTTGGRPRFVYWRDLTPLGRGFDPRVLQTLGLGP
ncbi:MAG: general secretion pathway protein GspK [Gemmatales bacterium]|nr:general secretion pathway protein GspK [Gemmatales bacterium]MDW8386896.1 type II secretion system protein GspK [Gemmatales bacterium]